MSVVSLPPPPPPGRLGFARHADVDLFVEKLEAFETGALSADDWRGFRLLNGVYGQRQDGVMMIRAKLPGGFVTPAQLEALAVVAERFGGGKGHVTTRQNVQYHLVPSADVEAALRILADAGITTKEACGHSVRNWTCCPFAGVAAGEPFDPTPYVEALARHLLRGKYSSTTIAERRSVDSPPPASSLKPSAPSFVVARNPRSLMNACEQSVPQQPPSEGLSLRGSVDE